MPKYLMRFDDITADMDWDKFTPIKEALEENNIYSVLGVVPKNEDPGLNIKDSLSEEQFFSKIREYKDYGDSIAQHGTYHVYKNQNPGILNINKDSEFSGVSYDEQLSDLEIGKKILEKHEVWQPYFMAPAHSFDINTLKALKTLGFKAITDGYGFYPYEIEGITLVPQLVSKPVPFIPFGVQTLCLHTNAMSQASIDKLINFINQNSEDFVNFKEVLDLDAPNKYFKYVTYNASKTILQLVRRKRN